LLLSHIVLSIFGVEERFIRFIILGLSKTARRLVFFHPDANLLVDLRYLTLNNLIFSMEEMSLALEFVTTMD